MEHVRPLLAVLSLLVLASAAAADAPAPDLQTPPLDAAPQESATAIQLDDLFATGDGCAPGDREQATVAGLDGQDELQLATQYCGACSVPICQGARRGQGCGWDSGGQKHCNIFSGGFMCPTGWWECQCQSGVLP